MPEPALGSGLGAALWLIAGATLLLIAMGWTFFRLVSSRYACPRCGSGEIRHSDTLLGVDGLLKLVAILPLRCLACGNRFYNLGRR